MISMAGLDWAKGPEGGIYLMGHDTSADEVRRGGGGLLGSKKIKGWAGGRFIPGDVRTSAEAIQLTGLDWLVERRPIIKVEPIVGVGKNGPEIQGWTPQETQAERADARGAGRQENDLPTGGWDIAADHVMNVRADNGAVLGVVGPGWRSPQNDEAFAFMDDLVEDDSAKWLAGGEIGGGKRVWMACQFEREVLIGGDLNERSIPLGFISNGWDGTLALSLTVGPYRLACLNGQSIPLEGYVRTWKARHSSGLNKEDRLQEARRTLQLSIGYFDAWTDAMNEMITAKVSQREVEAVIRQILPDPVGKDGKVGDRAIRNTDAKREALLTTYREADDLQHLGHTKYRVMNAVTAYADWGTKCPIEKQILRSAEPSKLKDAAYAALAAL